MELSTSHLERSAMDGPQFDGKVLKIIVAETAYGGQLTTADNWHRAYVGRP